jgi:hypothetical protein
MCQACFTFRGAEKRTGGELLFLRGGSRLTRAGFGTAASFPT